jgi:hypothetical protein
MVPGCYFMTSVTFNSSAFKKMIQGETVIVALSGVKSRV